MFGYLYVREHPSYDYTCKVGITDNIPDRDSTYATGELHRGTFSSVFKINLDSVDPPRVLKEREKDPRLKTVETKIKDTFLSESQTIPEATNAVALTDSVPEHNSSPSTKL